MPLPPRGHRGVPIGPHSAVLGELNFVIFDPHDIDRRDSLCGRGDRQDGPFEIIDILADPERQAIVLSAEIGCHGIRGNSIGRPVSESSRPLPPADPAYQQHELLVQIADHFFEVFAEPFLALSMRTEYGDDRAVLPPLDCLEGSIANADVVPTKSTTNKFDSPFRCPWRFDMPKTEQRLHGVQRRGNFNTIVAERPEKESPGVRQQGRGENFFRRMRGPVLERLISEGAMKAFSQTGPVGRRRLDDLRIRKEGVRGFGLPNDDHVEPVTRDEDRFLSQPVRQLCPLHAHRENVRSHLSPDHGTRVRHCRRADSRCVRVSGRGRWISWHRTTLLPNP